MKASAGFFLSVGLCLTIGACQQLTIQRSASDQMPQGKKAARSMIRASQTRLAPVYAPLAEYLTEHLNLAQLKGVGVDIGSGPGTLIAELCPRTSLHWINADINPYFFPYFFDLITRKGLAGRVSAIQADVHHLPFKDDYADVIISRGSYPFWTDNTQAFREIYRVLKPGAVAYIGRGFSENLPLETALEIRSGQGKKMVYPLDKKAQELRSVMEQLGLTDYRIHTPRSELHDTVNYGIWLEFRKTTDQKTSQGQTRR